jgi:hypothetical protein
MRCDLMAAHARLAQSRKQGLEQARALRTVEAVATRGPVSTMKSIPVFPYMSIKVPGSGTSE